MKHAHIDLPEDVVHIRRASFKALMPQLEALKKHLSAEELERTAQFHFDRHRDAFALGRGFLRALLAGYVDVDPRDIAFEYAAYGKPRLVPTQSGVRFNVSHSDDLMVCAVARNRELGVDCEALRENIELESMARRYFSAAETESLLSLPPQERVRGFFNCWTRKEAYIKAHGEGLSMPLNTFAVSLAPGQPAALLACDEPGEAHRWELSALVVPEGYAGAVVLEGKGARITYVDALPR